jgi:hypothetical protein
MLFVEKKNYDEDTGKNKNLFKTTLFHKKGFNLNEKIQQSTKKFK